MSTHPNVILMTVLRPDGLSRKTRREILGAAGITDVEKRIKIGSKKYDHIVMESDYDESLQIAADEGDIVFLNMVTYGYGETILWDKLKVQKNELEKWARETCDHHNCSYTIEVTANYW